MATRLRILDAARGLFAHKGYDGTSLREIATAADLTLGSLYHYFDQKAVLYREVLADLSTRLEPRYFEAIGGAETFVEGFRRFTEEGARINQEDPTYSLFLSTVPARRRQDPEIAEIRNPHVGRRHLRVLVDLGRATGEIDASVDPELFVQLLAALSGGMIYMMSEGWSPETNAAVLALANRMVAGDLVSSPRRGRATYER